MTPADKQLLSAIGDRIAGGIYRDHDGTTTADDRAALFGIVERLRAENQRLRERDEMLRLCWVDEREAADRADAERERLVEVLLDVQSSLGTLCPGPHPQPEICPQHCDPCAVVALIVRIESALEEGGEEVDDDAE